MKEWMPACVKPWVQTLVQGGKVPFFFFFLHKTLYLYTEVPVSKQRIYNSKDLMTHILYIQIQCKVINTEFNAVGYFLNFWRVKIDANKTETTRLPRRGRGRKTISNPFTSSAQLSCSKEPHGTDSEIAWMKPSVTSKGASADSRISLRLWREKPSLLWNHRNKSAKLWIFSMTWIWQDMIQAPQIRKAETNLKAYKMVEHETHFAAVTSFLTEEITCVLWTADIT